MLVVMSSYATEEEISQVVVAIEREGYVARVIQGGRAYCHRHSAE